MKKLNIIFIMFSVIMLSSCSGNNQRDEAYCFSMVFEKVNQTPTVTLYCKTSGSGGSEQQSVSDTKFSFSANSFTEAIISADKSDNEIYFNSTKTVYFSQDVTKDEIKQIMVYFLNHAKYQSCICIYTPQSTDNKGTQTLHSKATEVCINEKIKYTDQQSYTFATKLLRSIYG